MLKYQWQTYHKDMSLLILKIGILIALITVNSVAQETEEYKVKTGDVLSISVMGYPELNQSVEVKQDGTIFISVLGNIKVSDMTIQQITNLLNNRLEEYYKSPIVNISLQKFERITVHVLGQIRSPSFYQVPKNTTMQEAITMAGGALPSADMERIKLVRRRNGFLQEQIVDFTRFLKGAVLDSNPILEADDMIIVPETTEPVALKNRVTVIGAVASPGSHEITGATRLLSVITTAGGTSPEADLHAVRVITPSERRPSIKVVDLEDFLMKGDLGSNPLLKENDVVFVPTEKATEEAKQVNVKVVGQVQSPQAYPLSSPVRLFDAILAAGGFAETAQLNRIRIIRESGVPRIIEVDMGRYFAEGDLVGNPLLQDDDTVLVTIQPDVKRIPQMQSSLINTIRVSVIGEVTNPGQFQVLTDANYFDVITLAGGPTSNANLKSVMLIRQAAGEKMTVRFNLDSVLTSGEFHTLPPLQSGDTLFLPKLKERRNIFRAIVSLASDIAIIATAYWLLTGRTIR